MHINATGYATDQTSSQTQKKFSAIPMRTKVVAKVMLEDIKKPITKEKMMPGKLIIPQS
jgi:hypothetical protein